MCQCQCCCGSQVPPWWVTMGFVPPTNPTGGSGVHVATPVNPGTVVTAPPPGITIPGVGTVGGGNTVGPKGGNTGGSIGGTIGGIINTITNPLGTILGLL